MIVTCWRVEPNAYSPSQLTPGWTMDCPSLIGESAIGSGDIAWILAAAIHWLFPCYSRRSVKTPGWFAGRRRWTLDRLPAATHCHVWSRVACKSWSLIYRLMHGCTELPKGDSLSNWLFGVPSLNVYIMSTCKACNRYPSSLFSTYYACSEITICYNR